MTHRAISESQGKAAPRDERSGRSHATPRGAKDVADTLTGESGIGSRAKRIEDGFVGDHASPAPRQAVCGGVEHAADQRPVQRGLAASHETGFDQSRPVQWPGRATDRGRKSVPDGSQELTRSGFGGERLQRLAYRLEADGHIVAVIAVTQYGVQSGEVVAMALHGQSAASEVRAYLGALDPSQHPSRRRM